MCLMYRRGYEHALQVFFVTFPPSYFVYIVIFLLSIALKNLDLLGKDMQKA